MDLGGGWQHARRDIVIDLNGGISHDITQWFNIFIKVLQLLVDHGTKDSFNLALLGEGHVNEVEPAL